MPHAAKIYEHHSRRRPQMDFSMRPARIIHATRLRAKNSLLEDAGILNAMPRRSEIGTRSRLCVTTSRARPCAQNVWGTPAATDFSDGSHINDHSLRPCVIDATQPASARRKESGERLTEDVATWRRQTWHDLGCLGPASFKGGCAKVVAVIGPSPALGMGKSRVHGKAGILREKPP
jgi:hypothetical protein